jgi:hypothetical protein
MRESRNPFRLRASESIEMDALFVKLFGPGVLELLKGATPLEGLHFLRSAPGGGKTTLLRMFTPGPLLHLHAQRTQEDFRDLWKGMKELGSLDDNGPTLLGISLSCEHTYATLADMEADLATQRRLFFALLDSRVVLAGLRAALTLARREFPRDLGLIRLLEAAGVTPPPGISLPCDGNELFRWARESEEFICRAVDSFDGLAECPIRGSDTLTSLSWFRASSIQVDSQPVAQRLLVMLDDVHKLAPKQREDLRAALTSSRTSTGVWLAERLQSLSADELLTEGAIAGRDYQRVIRLEKFWQEYPRRFEQFVFNIADLRARQTPGRDMQDFRSCLETTLDDVEWNSTFERGKNVVRARVLARSGGRDLFKQWIEDREKLTGTPRQLALAWRTLEILIERELRRSQAAFDFSLDADELAEKDDNNLQTAAELFLAKEFNVPFYFGPSVLAKLASANIEQFLTVAGDQFEDLIANRLLKPGELLAISPGRQQEIISKASRAWWQQIPARVPQGQEVYRLLSAIAEFAHGYTHQPTAPNDPGVNGVAITMADRDRLMNSEYHRLHPSHARLAKLLAAALAHNLLHAQHDYKCKGKLFMVLNLNRLLCVEHLLPLEYGKFKEKTLDELAGWLERRPTQKQFAVV